MKPKVVYTSGTWDLFHIGHLNILKRSKELGTKLIVGVSTDELVASYKKSPPVISFKDRVEVLKSCQYVDEVVKQVELSGKKQIQKINPDIVTIGDDWKNKTLKGLDWFKKQKGKQLVYLPYTSRVSSTYIKNKIKNGWQIDKDSDANNYLSNKRVLITGSSSGIGKAIAIAFAKEGSRVGIHYSKSKKSAIEVAKIVRKYSDCKIYKQDFFYDSSSKIVKDFINDFGGIDILINNAGIILPKSTNELSQKDLEKIFSINTFAAYQLSTRAMEIMKKNNFGRIINISSISVKYGMGRNQSIHYAGTKAAIESLTIGLSRQGASYNILVNSIRPGVIMTNIQKERKNIKERINMIPVKRAGKPEDIANMCIYLASEKGNFITGEHISIAGGD